jgi:hypothetical protein
MASAPERQPRGNHAPEILREQRHSATAAGSTHEFLVTIASMCLTGAIVGEAQSGALARGVTGIALFAV